jgi:hypothetical protein
MRTLYNFLPISYGGSDLVSGPFVHRVGIICVDDVGFVSVAVK